MNLRCHKILISGGGSGIGKASAKRLLLSGAKVTLLGRNLEKLETARNELNNENVFILPGDVSKVEEIPSFLEHAAELMGGLDGLLNNAGVGSTQVAGSWEPWEITPEQWDTITSVDLKAAFFFMRDAVNFMLSHNVKKGNIVNICSNAACMAIAGPYGSAKLSLLKLTRTAGKKFGENGIIINGIAPGAVATPMISHYCKDENAPYTRHAIGRYIKPAEIAELVAYLMSDFGEIICGHTIVADGGDKNATL